MFENAELARAPTGYFVNPCPNHRIVKVSAAREFVALEMMAGWIYTARLADHPEQRGAPGFPRRMAVYDPNGAFLASAADGAHPQGHDVLCTFSPTLSGTHYLEARGCSFTLDAPERVVPETDRLRSAAMPDLQEARADATDLGDIACENASRISIAHFHADGKPVAFVRFALAQPGVVSLGMRTHRTDWELVLENADGKALCGRTHMHSGEQWLSAALDPGTYYARVGMPRHGGQPFMLRYKVEAGHRDTIHELQRQTAQQHDRTMQPARTNGAHILSDSVNATAARVSLGTIPIPEWAGDAVRHRIVGGNEAGLIELDARTGELFFAGTESEVAHGTTELDLTVRSEEVDRCVDQSVAVSVTRVETSPADAQGSRGPRISLGRVLAPHPAGVPLRFRLVGGNENGRFELDEATGELFFVGTEEEIDDAKAALKLIVRVDTDRH